MSKILKIIAGFFVPLFIKPENNIIIFTFDRDSFKFNTKALFEYALDKQQYKVKYIINNDILRNELKNEYGDHFITTNSYRDIKIISSARCWITDGGFPLKTPFNHKNRLLINLWHGIPLKKVGLQGYSGFGWLRVYLTLKMFSKNYSLFSSTSENLKSIYKDSFLIDESIIKTLGQPRNDYLFNSSKKIEDFIDAGIYNKVILYAPTWRSGIYGDDWEGEDTKFFPFNDFEQKKLEQYLEYNQILLCLRPHHLQKSEIENSKWIKDFSSDICNEVMDVINQFDLVITDYSSIYFDFLILNKPVLFLPYDLEEYINNVGLNFNFDKVTPGPKPKNQVEFIEEINKLLFDNEYYNEERIEVNKYFNQVSSGNCKRIYDFIEKELI